VLALSRTHPFARRLVNSGRLSTPTTHRASPLSTPDHDAFSGAMVPGAPAADAPVQVDGHAGWLLDHLGGRFDLLLFDADDADARELAAGLGDAVRIVRVTSSGAVQGPLIDFEGHAEHRYDARPGTAYLLRPDQHVAARWRSPTVEGVLKALARAQGH
jgi:3-(3-hydroxy-phenyl)propionate hydroxylase